jgi:RimJ/RimL family protein N-acetyltransferase
LNIITAGGSQPDLNRALAGWMEARLGLQRPFREPYSTMGIFHRNELIAALIFENYRSQEGTIEIGVASTSPHWLNRTVMNAMAEFVFGQLGCQMAYFRTSVKNLSACKLMGKVGFGKIIVPRGRGRNEDEILFYLSDDDWQKNPLNKKGRRGG